MHINLLAGLYSPIAALIKLGAHHFHCFEAVLLEDGHARVFYPTSTLVTHGCTGCGGQ